MSAWTGIRSLARRFLGVEEPEPADLSKIEADLARANEMILEFYKRSGAASPRSKGARHSPEAAESIEVLPEYEFVLEAIREECPAIFVTGRAGTGKSTLIRFLTEQIKNCAVVAPTALAAINVHGSTIHSFFSIPPRTLNPDEAFEPRRQIVPVIELLGALVIDEVSMVPPDLIDCISNTLKKVRRDPRPFGGVPVVFVGDLLQLPPVVSDPEVAQYYTDRYRSPYFFSADVFQETELIPIELTKVFRQSGREFVDMLDKIRLNDSHRDAVAKINRDCYRDKEPSSDPALFLVPTNAAAKAINTQNLGDLQTPLRVFDAIVEGRFDVQRDRFQAPHRLEIKEGAQILFVKNNKPYWVNGTLGRIVQIEEDRLRIEIDKVGNIVSVERAVWEKIRYEYDRYEQRIVSTVVGSFEQFPIALGWAITIHKSQGMTLDSVRIDLGRGAFCSGQTYVALSRCRTLEGISLDTPISMGDVKADEMILEFYKRLKPLRDQTKAQQDGADQPATRFESELEDSENPKPESELRRLRRAAELGDADAQFSLGICYALGDGVVKDLTEATKWYLKAAEQGQADVQNNFGVCYTDGLGVPKDDEEAVKWYRRAAEQGHAVGQRNLGMVYNKGLGVPEDEAEAVKWFSMAAEQGDTEAQLMLGNCYCAGNGVAKDATEAVKWWRKAAEQGHAVGQRNLGVAYGQGLGVPEDDAEGVKWLDMAAEQGETEAQLMLGVKYFRGEGVSRDVVIAYKWWNIASPSEFSDLKTLMEDVSEGMTREQIAEAEKQAQEWRDNRCD